MSKTIRRPKITIHYGAIHNEIVIDGVRFDRSELTRDQLNQVSRMTNEALKRCGYFRKRRHEPYLEAA